MHIFENIHLLDIYFLKHLKITIKKYDKSEFRPFKRRLW